MCVFALELQLRDNIDNLIYISLTSEMSLSSLDFIKLVTNKINIPTHKQIQELECERMRMVFVDAFKAIGNIESDCRMQFQFI